MATSKKQTVKKVVLSILAVLAVVILSVTAYRYWNRPVQTWTAENFEGRNPDTIQTKNQGQKFWGANQAGNGFYVTDEAVTPGDNKTYCVTGGAGTDTATFTLGNSSATVKNGFFTHCASLTVNDKHQLNFTLTDGSVQVYSVDRKR